MKYIYNQMSWWYAERHHRYILFRRINLTDEWYDTGLYQHVAMRLLTDSGHLVEVATYDKIPPGAVVDFAESAIGEIFCIEE